MRPRSIVKKEKKPTKKGKNLQKSSKNSQKKSQKDTITPKQLRFCHEYVIDSNGKQAAIRAGYSEHSAEKQASRLLRIEKVKGKVEELQLSIVSKLDISAEYVLEGIKTIAERCLGNDPNYKFDPKNANAALKMLGEHKGLFKKVLASDPDNPFLTGVVNIINIPSNGRELKDS